MRPFDCAFDPVGISFSSERKQEAFEYLREALSRPVPGLENCNVAVPSSLGVPWPTSFPAAAQCKHWRQSEEAAEELMDEILAASPEERGSLPPELFDPSKKAAKRKELIDASVAAEISIFPQGDAPRARILSKANVLIFTHDDVIESDSVEIPTILDTALADSAGRNGTDDEFSWTNKIFKGFSDECLRVDPVMGPTLVRGLVLWVEHTRKRFPSSMTFNSLEEYFDYRFGDFAITFLDLSMMWSCGLPAMTPAEREPLKTFHGLYMIYCSATNDLYSYDKELLALHESGAALVNCVRVIELLLNVKPRSAKVILRAYLWDIELQMNEELIRLDKTDLSPNQKRLARGWVEMSAGNLLCCATCLRYAKPGLKGILTYTRGQEKGAVAATAGDCRNGDFACDLNSYTVEATA
ncbi:terpenoid synthase [Rostrohypoxylon terebratum]|nr:terpenoid synthase [Rostrohypoxylon terebratum]